MKGREPVNLEKHQWQGEGTTQQQPMWTINWTPLEMFIVSMDRWLRNKCPSLPHGTICVPQNLDITSGEGENFPNLLRSSFSMPAESRHYDFFNIWRYKNFVHVWVCWLKLFRNIYSTYKSTRKPNRRGRKKMQLCKVKTLETTQ